MSIQKKINFTIISLYHIKNLGVRYIHAFLTSKGYNVNLIFFKHSYFNNATPPTNKEIDQLITLLKRCNTHIVGISVSCSAYMDTAIKLTTKIKQAMNIFVIWGGIHPTVEPEECLNFADIVCIGEGEYPMSELLEALETGRDITGIKNLWFKIEDGVIKNPIRELIHNLDTLPFPDYSNDNKYYLNKGQIHTGDPIHMDCWDYFIQATRGCPYKCTYCSNNVLKRMYNGKGYVRQRSVEHVINELIHVKNQLKGLKMITFFDEIFGINKKWMQEFCRQYKQKIGLPFSCYLHPLAVNDEVVSLLREAGVSLIGMGIQSGSERIRRQIFKRPESDEQIIKATRILRKYRIPLVLDLILDNPFETYHDKENALNLLLRIPRPFKLSLYSLIYFPGTELTNMALKQGIITTDDIEHRRQRILSQFRVTMEYKRDKSDTAWIALLILSGTPLIFKWLTYFLARRKLLRIYPQPLVILVYIINGIHWIQKCFHMLFTGQITPSLIRRFMIRIKQ